MAPPAPVRPSHATRKRQSHDGSIATGQRDEQQTFTPSRRASQPASRPQLDTRESASSTIPSRTTSPSSLPASTSSPKPTRLGSALSFFRTHSHTHPTKSQRRRTSSSSASSADGSASGSGSSDGDSEAMPRRHLLGRRRSSTKSSEAAKTSVEAVAKESPAYRKADLKKAVMFARKELMNRVEASGKNALVLEG